MSHVCVCSNHEHGKSRALILDLANPLSTQHPEAARTRNPRPPGAAASPRPATPPCPPPRRSGGLSPYPSRAGSLSRRASSFCSPSSAPTSPSAPSTSGSSSPPSSHSSATRPSHSRSFPTPTSPCAAFLTSRSAAARSPSPLGSSMSVIYPYYAPAKATARPRR